jgi:ribonuclease PH
LIGRSLRAITDMEAMGERTLWIDCDVLQADGGTRTASITGSFVALAEAFGKLQDKGELTESPLIDSVAAVSVGIIGGVPLLDLNYAEDSTAQVDMNVVMTGGGRLVEVQGTAEQGSFERSELDTMIDLAAKGISELCGEQDVALGAPRAD